MKEVAENHVIHFDHDENDHYKVIRLFLDGHWGERVVLYGAYDTHARDELQKQLIGLKIEEAIKQHKSIGLQRDSEFTELFNYHILKLFEMGVMHRLMQKYVINNNEEYGIAEPITLGYENLFFPFGIILLGAILSVVAIIGEFISKLMENRQT